MSEKIVKGFRDKYEDVADFTVKPAKGRDIQMAFMQKISRTIQENNAWMNQILPIQESFDLIQRDMQVGGRAASFYFLDGMIKDDAMVKVMDTIFQVQEKEMPDEVTGFVQKHIPYVEVDVIGDLEQAVKNVLSGVTVLFIDGYEAAIAIDCRT